MYSQLLEGLGDSGTQSGNSVLPGLFGLSVEAASQFLSEDFLEDGTELLYTFQGKFELNKVLRIKINISESNLKHDGSGSTGLMGTSKSVELTGHQLGA